MNYTVGTVRQALLDQGITELHLNDVTYPVETTDAHALLYLVIFDKLINAGQTLSSDNNDYVSRTAQALQMFGIEYVTGLIEDCAARNQP